MLVREDIVTRLFLGGIVILENVNRASSTSICIGACSGTLWRRLLSRDGHVRSGRSRSHRVFLLFNNNRITSTRMIKQKDGEEDNHGNSHDTGGSNQDPRERVSVRFVWIIISARAPRTIGTEQRVYLSLPASRSGVRVRWWWWWGLAFFYLRFRSLFSLTVPHHPYYQRANRR